MRSKGRLCCMWAVILGAYVFDRHERAEKSSGGGRDSVPQCHPRGRLYEALGGHVSSCTFNLPDISGGDVHGTVSGPPSQAVYAAIQGHGVPDLARTCQEPCPVTWRRPCGSTVKFHLPVWELLNWIGERTSVSIATVLVSNPETDCHVVAIVQGYRVRFKARVAFLTPWLLNPENLSSTLTGISGTECRVTKPMKSKEGIAGQAATVKASDMVSNDGQLVNIAIMLGQRFQHQTS